MHETRWLGYLKPLVREFLDTRWPEEWPGDDWDKVNEDFTKKAIDAINVAWDKFQHAKNADPWDVKKLGWQFGSEGSALVALRGCLEQADLRFQIGRNTLYDALREYSEIRRERDQLRQLVEPAKALLDIVNESKGITGWHLNGATALWDEFGFVGAFDTVIDALAEPRS